MVHIHLFRSAFSLSHREHRLLGMAGGETPFMNATEIEAARTRVETRLNNDPDHTTTEAEYRVTTIKLELSNTHGTDDDVRNAARSALAALRSAYDVRNDSRANVTKLCKNQDVQRATLLTQLNASPADPKRATALDEIRTEIAASLAAIRQLSDSSTLDYHKFTRGEIITAHLAHISKLQNIQPTSPLSPLEKASLRTSLATEMAGDEPSKLRLGKAYLLANGYTSQAVTPPTLAEFTLQKEYRAPAYPTSPVLSLTFKCQPGDKANNTAQMWTVEGTIGGVTLPATKLDTTFNPLTIDAAIARDPAAQAVFGARAAGQARKDLIHEYTVATDLQQGVQAAESHPNARDIVRTRVVDAEAKAAKEALEKLGTDHSHFIARDFETQYLSADKVKVDAASSNLAIRNQRILDHLNSPTGLRKVATDRKVVLDAQIKDLVTTKPGTDLPSNVVAQVTELRRQILDIDVQLRDREEKLGVATTVTAAGPAPKPTTATTPNIPNSGPVSLNNIARQSQPFLELILFLGPIISMLNPNFNNTALTVALDRMDLQIQLRDAQDELAAFDRANPSLTTDLKNQRTLIQTRITELERKINVLPAIPSNTNTGLPNHPPEEMVEQFANDLARRLNTFIAPNTTSVVAKRYIVIDTNRTPAGDIQQRLNLIMSRFGNARAPQGIPGIPSLANQPNSHIVALDASIIFQQFNGDINSIFRGNNPALTPPPFNAGPAPVVGPVISSNNSANASINGYPPKPRLGASSRRSAI